ncbi:hypothetical protein D0V11_20890 [Salmonella enterica]|nr:hypothetical protein [Salmonella enterica]
MKDGLFKISGEVSAFFSELALTENLMKKVENEGIERGGASIMLSFPKPTILMSKDYTGINCAGY